MSFQGMYGRLARTAWARLGPDERRRLTRLRHPVRLPNARRTRPVSERYGSERGRPVDRYYIDRFLAAHREDIHGSVLEIKDSTYTRRFGPTDVQAHVLDVEASNPEATMIGDLGAPSGLDANGFDCVILTQTLQYLPDVRQGIVNTHRALKPGGVLLATMPAIARVHSLETDLWRFTVASTRAVVGPVFGAERIDVRAHGNVLVAIAFLLGLAQKELSRHELDDDDPHVPVIVTLRAVRGST